MCPRRLILIWHFDSRVLKVQGLGFRVLLGGSPPKVCQLQLAFIGALLVAEVLDKDLKCGCVGIR